MLQNDCAVNETAAGRATSFGTLLTTLVQCPIIQHHRYGEIGHSFQTGVPARSEGISEFAGLQRPTPGNPTDPIPCLNQHKLVSPCLDNS